MPDTANVYLLDLAFIFPTMLTAIVGLVRLRDWAWSLAGSLVILTAAMLGSLVVADGIATLSDVTPDPLPLVIVFAPWPLPRSAPPGTSCADCELRSPKRPLSARDEFRA